jgi:hypothetical protein
MRLFLLILIKIKAIKGLKTILIKNKYSTPIFEFLPAISETYSENPYQAKIAIVKISSVIVFMFFGGSDN